MYFFVRFTGAVIVVVGVLLMFAGFGAAIYGFLQNAILVDYVNSVWMVGSNSRLVDFRFYAAVFGLGLFLIGMLASGLGQLMLVFADVAINTRETNNFLRGMRRLE
jgi:hypothetical protein